MSSSTMSTRSPNLWDPVKPQALPYMHAHTHTNAYNLTSLNIKIHPSEERRPCFAKLRRRRTGRSRRGELKGSAHLTGGGRASLRSTHGSESRHAWRRDGRVEAAELGGSGIGDNHSSTPKLQAQVSGSNQREWCLLAFFSLQIYKVIFYKVRLPKFVSVIQGPTL